MNEPSDEDKRKKKVSMGAAILRPMEERDHFGLYRPLMIDQWDDVRGKFVRMVPDDPIGPLAIFRIARRDDAVHMRTIHPETQRELHLTCVWDNDSGTFLKSEEN